MPNDLKENLLALDPKIRVQFASDIKRHIEFEYRQQLEKNREKNESNPLIYKLSGKREHLIANELVLRLLRRAMEQATEKGILRLYSHILSEDVRVVTTAHRTVLPGAAKQEADFKETGSVALPSKKILEAAAAKAKESKLGRSVDQPLESLVTTTDEVEAYFDAFSGKSTANFIRAARKTAGLSQGQLAGKLGVSQSRVAELESGAGKQGPTIGILAKIAVACGRRLFLSLR